MAFLDRLLGVSPALLEATSPTGADYSSDVTPPARSAAQPVTVERTVGLPAAFRALQLISSLGATLALESYRRDQLVDPRPALLRQPDPWRPRLHFLRRFLLNAATDGNNFLLKHPGADGSIHTGGVELLNPHTTSVRWETKQGRRRKLYDGVDPRTGRARTFTADEVEHVWCGLEVAGHTRALGPIAACRASVAGVLDTRDYAAGWFSRDLDDVPSGVLTSDQRLTPEEARQHRKVWHNPQGFDAEGNPLPRVAGGPSVRILGQGLRYEPVLLKPADAQWLESQAFGVLETARMFGMPAEYLEAAVDGSSLVYSSLPMLASRFLTTTLYPVYLSPLEAALTGLLPHGQEALFSAAAGERPLRDELLRPDAKTRAEVDAIYVREGVYDGAYVRRRDRIAGADHVTRPTPAPTVGAIQ